jgi:hypothetical protein
MGGFPQEPIVIGDCSARGLAPRDITQLHVVSFDQAAAVTANIHPIEAAEAEEALVQNENCAVHDPSCVVWPLNDACLRWSPRVAATVKSKTAAYACFFRAGANFISGVRRNKGGAGVSWFQLDRARQWRAPLESHHRLSIDGNRKPVLCWLYTNMSPA